MSTQTLDKPRIDKITIIREPDEDGCESYLHTEYDEKTHKIIKSMRYSDKDVETYGWNRVLQWILEDHKRLDEYGQTWHTIGIHAEATVSYSVDNRFRRGDALSSSGLWGIESDSSEDDFKEIEHEQLDDLKEHLQHFGIDVSNFEIVPVERRE